MSSGKWIMNNETHVLPFDTANRSWKCIFEFRLISIKCLLFIFPFGKKPTCYGFKSISQKFCNIQVLSMNEKLWIYPILSVCTMRQSIVSYLLWKYANFNQRLTSHLCLAYKMSKIDKAFGNYIGSIMYLI